MHFGKDNFPGDEYFREVLYVYWTTFPLAIKIVLIGYLALLIYFLIFGNKKERMFFLVSLVVLVITCLNPRMAWYLANNWGFGDRYFRLFWIIPVAMGYTVTGIKCYERFKIMPIKIGIYVLLVVLYIFSFEQIWRKSFEVYTGHKENTGLVPVSNIYKVEDDVVVACDMIEQDANDLSRIKVTLYDSSFFIEARTYDAAIVPLYPYANYQKAPLDQAIKENNWHGVLSDAYTGELDGNTGVVQDSVITSDLIRTAAKEVGCEYVIIDKQKAFVEEWIDAFSLLGESEYYYVLKVE